MDDGDEWAWQLMEAAGLDGDLAMIIQAEIDDPDWMVGCECSECRHDVGSHAINIGASMDAFKRALLEAVEAHYE